MADFHPDTHEVAFAASEHGTAANDTHRPAWLDDALSKPCATYKDILSAGPPAEATVNTVRKIVDNANQSTPAASQAARSWLERNANDNDASKPWTEKLGDNDNEAGLWHRLPV